MKKIFIILFIAPFFLMAQNTDSIFIKRIANEVLRNGTAYDLLRQLTKQIGGRVAGSVEANKAEKWGYEALKKCGADTVFFQECLVPHWVRGKGDEVSVIGINNKPIIKKLDAAALGNSIGSMKPVIASVIVIENFEELERRQTEIKGKIVFFNAGFNVTNIKTGKSYGETGIYRRNGASRAAKYGAVGIIIRSLTEATDNHPHTGNMTYNDSFPKIPAVAIGLDDANYLSNVAKKMVTKISLLTHGKLLPDVLGNNVVAEMKGNLNPNEYITIGGHLDSWDLGEGAHDDGAGIVHTMEVLRTLKALGYQPNCTIRFVLFANEENGLRGAEKYASLAKLNNEKHVFALESDAGGFTPRGFGFTMSAEKLKAIQPWVTLLKPYGTDDLIMGGGGADIGPLNKLFGTPMAGLSPDSQRYFDVHHARSDIFENVNKRELLLGAINMAGLIYLIDKYGL